MSDGSAEIQRREADVMPKKDDLHRMTLDEARAAFQRILDVDTDGITTAEQLAAFSEFPNALTTMTNHLLDRPDTTSTSPNHYESSWTDDEGDRQKLSVTYPRDPAFENLSFVSTQDEIDRFRSKTTPAEVMLSSRASEKGKFLFTIGLAPIHPEQEHYDTVSITNYDDEGNYKNRVDMWTGKLNELNQPEDFKLTAKGIQQAVRVLSQRDQTIKPAIESPSASSK